MLKRTVYKGDRLSMLSKTDISSEFVLTTNFFSNNYTHRIKNNTLNFKFCRQNVSADITQFLEFKEEIIVF